jgi:hypothetical protein
LRGRFGVPSETPVRVPNIIFWPVPGQFLSKEVRFSFDHSLKKIFFSHFASDWLFVRIFASPKTYKLIQK